METSMKRAITITITILTAIPILSYASNEDNFNVCVKMKDLTLDIANQADSGVSRSSMKARYPRPSVHELIDFVYDFRGAYSNKEIAAKNMDSCLRQLKVR